ncbi:MAG: ABC transporter ATP-binding protein [Clostridiales bacterium]|nr:ABC transporter ATP-binding protein [Clostridiales bacterium]
MSVVTISNLYKSFGDVEVLKSINDEFQDGEFVTLLGPSGCGKTTLLRIIAGFEKPTKGQVLIDGKVVSSEDVFVPPEHRNIGMVFQSYAVWPHMNVFENVAYPLKIKKVSKDIIKEKVDNVLKLVHLSQYAKRIPSQLSGGQQQRVALARALVAEPDLLLLDEPLSNLDAKLRESMRYEIKELTQRLGITVIFVTHDQVEAMTMSDRVLVINRGIIQQVGTPYEIYRNPANQFVSDFVGKVNFIKGKAHNGIVSLNLSHHKFPCNKDLEGDVVLAVRPESIKFVASENGNTIKGKIEKLYFIGEEVDCFVDIDGEIIRVSAPPEIYADLKQGQDIYIEIKDYLVYKDDGSDDHTKILT